MMISKPDLLTCIRCLKTFSETEDALEHDTVWTLRLFRDTDDSHYTVFTHELVVQDVLGWTEFVATGDDDV